MALITAKRNREIYDELSEIVIGHDYAKKVLINTVNRSKLRYFKKWHLEENVDALSISNCLLIGGSGTGKTFLVESLAKVMNFPWLRLDATDLNPTGASGGIKRENIISKIKKKAENMVEKHPNLYFSPDGTVDQMIVFVDEVDKLANSFTSGNWNEHVQSNFLTIFENRDALAGVTFVFAGAFTSMKLSKKESKPLGFTTSLTKGDKKQNLEKEIIDYGLLPEFVGRLNHIVVLDEFEEEHYIRVFDKIIMPKIRAQLLHYGIENFEISEDKQKEMIKRTMENKLGVRGLETEARKLTVDLEFEPPDNYPELTCENT